MEKVKQYKADATIPVVSGSAVVIINGMETNILTYDEIHVTYEVKIRWWLRWLVREVEISPTIERVRY